MTEYVFRAYCDICHSGFGWGAESEARADREQHFEEVHEDNPMVTQNCRIQRRVNGDE